MRRIAGAGSIDFPIQGDALVVLGTAGAVVPMVTITAAASITPHAHDAEHASHPYSIGVSDAVPETIAASLQLSEAVLVGLGIPTGFLIASTHGKRDEFRHALQAAARAAGVAQTRALRRNGCVRVS